MAIYIQSYIVGRLIGREYALFSSLTDFGGVKKNKRTFHKFFVTLVFKGKHYNVKRRVDKLDHTKI